MFLRARSSSSMAAALRSLCTGSGLPSPEITAQRPDPSVMPPIRDPRSSKPPLLPPSCVAMTSWYGSSESTLDPLTECKPSHRALDGRRVSHQPRPNQLQRMGQAHYEFRKRSECEDSFDYVGSTSSWTRSSSMQDFSCRYRLCDDFTRAWCLFDLEFFFLLLINLGWVLGGSLG